MKKLFITVSLRFMLFFFAVPAGAELLNDWTFEADPFGLTLSQAGNVGSEGSVFASGGGGFLKTDGLGGLLCTNDAVGTTGMWTNGAILDARVASRTSGVCYLRYDVEYSLTNSLNDSGMVLGAYFTDGASNKVAGLVLNYNDGTSVTPTNYKAAAVSGGIALSGTLTAIAAADIGSGTIKVWYRLTGTNTFDINTPNFSTNITLANIGILRFQATGDFRPAGSTDYATVDNLRMASTWADITAPIPDFSTGPAVEIVGVTVTNPRETFGTEIGETNTVKVVIRNLNAPAGNLISSVSAAAHPEYFSILSSNTPVVLTYPDYVTNTFFLIANTNTSDGAYTFNVNVTGSGGVHTNTTFTLAIGSLISYRTNSITEVSGGSMAGKFEPGETLDITVFSTNNGALAVSNVVNSLYADPACFAISNLTSSAYSLMPVGAATSTVYRVTILPSATNGANWFSVTNRNESTVWPGSFAINVFKQGVPSVSPQSVTMNMLPGASTNAEVTVTNSGNVAFTFNITDDGTWGTFYTSVPGNRGISGFEEVYTVIALKDPNTNSSSIEARNAGVSSAADIGFGFPFYGVTYSNFYVTADGYIGLSNTTNVPAQSLDRQALPVTAIVDPFIAPFWGTLNSPTGSIRMVRSKNNYLVISYTGVSKESGSTNLQFQAALFTNGCIEFRYKAIAGVTNSYGLTNVTIGLQGGAGGYTNLTALKPVNGTSVWLTPQTDRWVSSPSQSVTIDPQSSRVVTFTANASGKAAGVSTTFNAWFNWSTGGSNAVAVSASVITAAPVYSAVSSLSFTGAAGQVAFATFVITNAGNGPLNFTIIDTNNAVVDAYFGSNSAAYSWIDISSTGTTVPLNDPDPSPYITAADEGYSAMIPLKFAFPFYGGNYTQFCVSVNGALRLDTAGRVFAWVDLAPTNSRSLIMPAQMIAPYWGDLVMDANATIKYLSTAEQLVITWENLRQYGTRAGSNQIFQAILKPSGDITFQYKKLEGAISWPNTTIGVRDADNTFVRYGWTKLRRPGDWIVSTNLHGTVSTQYVSAVSNRAVQFRPTQIRVIGYTPSGGSIAAGGTAEITITGDASNQSDGFNSISAHTTLSISNNAGSAQTLDVTFAVTNSAETGFVRESALADSGDSDGDGIPDDQERIAGTDPQNADSVFSPVIGRDPSGAFLSWPAPLDGVQRTYTVYFSTNLLGGWNYLGTVTSGTSYLDTEHSSAPVVYYKVTVPVQ